MQSLRDHMLDPHQTVAQIVLDHAETAAVFQRHRIDFCCKGDTSVADACRQKGLDAAEVTGELEAVIAARHADAPDPRAMTTGVLIAYIVDRHHAYLRQALPSIQVLADKVARVHGDREPALREVADVVDELIEALFPHLAVEEETLFPAMLAPVADRAVLNRELPAMTSEHEAVGALLGRLREATGDYAVPEWGCRSYRALFSELAALEADVLRHVHLENHVLAPRFAR